MSTAPPQSSVVRIGADENGLGARLGPMLVTAAMAEVEPAAQQRWSRRLPKSLRADLDDSKRLVSFGNHALGEAWARVLHPAARTPGELLAAISAQPMSELQSVCPKRAVSQCWEDETECFGADDELLTRVRKCLTRLERRGIRVLTVRSSPVCVGRLNSLRAAGVNRFAADLHAMEELILGLRESAGVDVMAVCGKVGGISDYPKHFGPLSGRLHVVLEQKRPHSSYRFPGLGQLDFVQDADDSDPLVMLASLVGKYLRELLMARISRFYTSRISGLKNVSGYHDPVTTRLVQLSAPKRRSLGIPQRCFERASDQ